MFTGSYVALVTPFKNGKIDEKALGDLIEWQIDRGTNGLVPCGSTGESATLTHEEHDRVIELTVEVARRRVPVIAGTGSNATHEAIRLTKHAKSVGVDAALLVTPYYNKPTQEGLFRHFEAIARAVDLPLVLYNIPGRSVVNMTPQTVARLSAITNIVGIKEASGNLSQMSDVIAACGERFVVLSGDDALTLPLMAVGGKGVISVTANVAPAETADMVSAALKGDWDRAKRVHYRLLPLSNSMFLETNPIPVKAALAMMGRCADELRLPLTTMSDAPKAQLRQALLQFGLV
ncbi:MAG TPA: 4-hydroxy-tetrahydrodipicolinate synthase [Nitrospiria bacterium]|nr:4-hydroxy-tetrahydrodipicolinate synthase [Nitrospiria bacterium]